MTCRASFPTGHHLGRLHQHHDALDRSQPSFSADPAVTTATISLPVNDPPTHRDPDLILVDELAASSHRLAASAVAHGHRNGHRSAAVSRTPSRSDPRRFGPLPCSSVWQGDRTQKKGGRMARIRVRSRIPLWVAAALAVAIVALACGTDPPPSARSCDLGHGAELVGSRRHGRGGTGHAHRGALLRPDRRRGERHRHEPAPARGRRSGRQRRGTRSASWSARPASSCAPRASSASWRLPGLRQPRRRTRSRPAIASMACQSTRTAWG